jgi:hypothetical protein
LLIPRFDILAGALGTIVGYGSMSLFSYVVGQKFYKIPYNVLKIGFYFSLAILLYLLSECVLNHFIADRALKFSINNGLILLFVFLAYQLERKNLFKKSMHV